MKLRQLFDEFSDVHLLEFINFLLKNGKRAMVLSALFQQLYRDGEVNNQAFYQSMISKSFDFLCQSNSDIITSLADECKYKGTTEHVKLAMFSIIDSLPDTVMCKIGSYMSCRDLFRVWNKVNRKFLQIAYHASTIQSWDFGCGVGSSQTEQSKMCNIMRETNVQFKLDPLVSKLTFMNYDANYSALFQLSSAKSVTNITIGMFTHCILIIQIPFTIYVPFFY